MIEIFNIPNFIYKTSMCVEMRDPSQEWTDGWDSCVFYNNDNNKFLSPAIGQDLEFITQSFYSEYYTKLNLEISVLLIVQWLVS